MGDKVEVPTTLLMDQGKSKDGVVEVNIKDSGDSPKEKDDNKKNANVDDVTKCINRLNLSTDADDEDDDDDEEDEEEGRNPLFLSDMNPAVQRRIRALRKNQLEIIDIETNFYKEMHQLETKYEKLYKEKFDLRRGVVSGSHEPTEEECDFPLVSGHDTPTPPATVDAKKDGEKEGPSVEKVKGIPMFWATVLQSVDPVSSLIEDEDVSVLKHLTDIRFENITEPLGFKLFFNFSPNDYFENDVLTKVYYMNNDPDPANPLGYEGPEIISCKGCTVNWKPGKDTTTATVEKRQKHKKNGTIRTVTKTVKMNSFFNFFNPPNPDVVNMSVVNEDDEDDIIDILNVDFEIGQALRERIIPRAILYFTGEALEDDTDFATETEDEDGDEDNPDSDSGDDDDVEEQEG